MSQELTAAAAERLVDSGLSADLNLDPLDRALIIQTWSVMENMIPCRRPPCLQIFKSFDSAERNPESILVKIASYISWQSDLPHIVTTNIQPIVILSLVVNGLHQQDRTALAQRNKQETDLAG